MENQMMEREPVPNTELIGFDEVYNEVQKRADNNMDDFVGAVTSILVRDDLSVEFPDMDIPGPYTITNWGWQQLASWMGVRYDKYFDPEYTEPKDIENSVNRLLMNRNASFRVRAKRTPNNGHVGQIRAFLSPSYHPIDDMDLFNLLLESKNKIPYFIRNRTDVTDKCSYFTTIQDTDLEVIPGDKYHMGFIIKNSEVGCAALKFQTYVWRLECSNGLMAQVKKPLFSRRHTLMTEQSEQNFRDGIVEIFAKYALERGITEQKLKSLSEHSYSNTTQTREALQKILMNAEGITNSSAKIVLQEFDDAPGVTAYDQLNAITAGARFAQSDQRFDMEAIAGRLLESGAFLTA